MTKKEEQQLIKKVNQLEITVAKLQRLIDNNKLEKPYYSVNEVAEMLNKHPRTVRYMIERGELETVKLGTMQITKESLLGHI